MARIEVGATGESPQAFYVRDNGAGFNPAFADKVFGVFQRLHALSRLDVLREEPLSERLRVY